MHHVELKIGRYNIWITNKIEAESSQSKLSNKSVT
jgi:hypothetical protein